MSASFTSCLAPDSWVVTNLIMYLAWLQSEERNIGMVEYWNDVEDKKTKILSGPIFQYSNIPVFQLRS